MNIKSTPISGLLVIQPSVFGDARGYFLETWQHQRYAAAGMADAFVQDNISFSRQGILRGLHFQNPRPQAKLVSVLQGEVFDVAVDLRRNSPTFGQWHGERLSAENKLQFFIPVGFAHGFQVLSETVLFHYKCTEYYAPADEQALRWDDPALNIQWPGANPQLSARDSQAPLLKDLDPSRLF
jgi:dTDP-4-dehydrorhamnose 3,5-epimerase